MRESVTDQRARRAVLRWVPLATAVAAIARSVAVAPFFEESEEMVHGSAQSKVTANRSDVLGSNGDSANTGAADSE